MDNIKRTLRSNAPAATLPSVPPVQIQSPVTFTSVSDSANSSDVQILRPESNLPGLSSTELSLLRCKQKKLAKTAPSTLLSLPPGSHSLRALESSLIFAQDAAGSAVCIDPAGWVLTCSHCFAESEADFQVFSRRRWLLYYTGLAVLVECRFWDGKRDLALAKIITVETAETNGQVPTFQYVELSSSPPSTRTSIICIAQPGSEDLESATVRKTKYNLVEISEGCFRGMVPHADPQENSNIGSLKHDAWTYWGHSGAPLLKATDGSLLGLHSSWDSETGMRHGIPLVAIRDFLQSNFPSVFRSRNDSSENTKSQEYIEARSTKIKNLQNKTFPQKSGDDLSSGRPGDVARHPVIVLDDDK